MRVGGCSNPWCRRNSAAGLRSARGRRLRAERVAGHVPRDRRRLELRLTHGSIVDANARALVLGIFRNVDPSGPAAALDARLGGAIHELTLRRMFDGSLGQVYVLPAPRAALIAEFVAVCGARRASMSSARSRWPTPPRT